MNTAIHLQASPKPAGRMLTGLAASSGIARGEAYVCACGDSPSIARRPIANADLPTELRRLEKAIAEVEVDLFELRDDTLRNLGNESAAIFEAQACLLRDPELLRAVATRCEEQKINVEAAWSDTVDFFDQAFARLDDPTMRERATDLRDVTRRLLGRLQALAAPCKPSFPAGCIVITQELLPSLAAKLDPAVIRGIVAERGGPTAHAVILARALGIPTLLYVEDATRKVSNGDPLILDALAGRLFIRPPLVVEREYRRHEADLVKHRALLKEALHLPAETRDGVKIKLCANIGKIADASVATEVNAAGIGLYRTEFVFVVEDHLPTEEEQYQIYRKTADAIADRELVIRALDVGSDKLLPYFPLPSEPNPSLGQRATRLLLKHPEILIPQLRAVLRLSATHRIALLFPMIGGVDEILAAKAQLKAIQAQLRAEHVSFNRELRIGAMIETPSAVLMARYIAQEVDFLSIGTNDLTQYLLASDRSSHVMANYYEPLHPAVMLSIKAVVDAAAAEGKDVSVCGEMAGNPAYTELLLGLGIRTLSVVPGELLEVKRVIRAVTTGNARQLAECVLSARTIAAVKECLAARAKTRANAASGTPRPIKTPAEAAWENEGGHILPLTGALVGAQPITTQTK